MSALTNIFRLLAQAGAARYLGQHPQDVLAIAERLAFYPDRFAIEAS